MKKFYSSKLSLLAHLLAPLSHTISTYFICVLPLHPSSAAPLLIAIFFYPYDPNDHIVPTGVLLNSLDGLFKRSSAEPVILG